MGLKMAWKDYRGMFDYLVKADDDTYIIIENLRYMLKNLSQQKELLLGHMQEDRGVKYPSGGAGYVLSHDAVGKIVEEGLQGEQPCFLPHPVGQEVDVYPNEDLQLGKCADTLNIPLVTSMLKGQSTFLPFSIERHIISSLSLEWWTQRTHECHGKMECVSPTLVSIHYVSPEMMYVYQYFVYEFKRMLL